MNPIPKTIACLTLAAILINAPAQEARIEVHAEQVIHKVSRYLTGACIEDVNHEVYGGIDSQMIFGESFAEPAPAPSIQGFNTFGGRWLIAGSELVAPDGDGPKLVRNMPGFSEGEASVDLWFSEQKSGNAGLIVKVSEPEPGADRFNGYEISLETSGRLVLGRHRRNWEPIQTALCEVPLRQWIQLKVRMKEDSLEIRVNGNSLIRFQDTQHPLKNGTVGLRTWQRDARFRNLEIAQKGRSERCDFAVSPADAWGDGVSGMWRALRRGHANGDFQLESQGAYSGSQSQRLTFKGGDGEIGLENKGLNRWGMNFKQDKSYEGFICARSAQPAEVWVALENGDGSKVLAEKKLEISGSDWQRLDFTLEPNGAESAGRFAVKLKRPGSVLLGYALVQPGAWGRFKGLPTRRDVAEGLIQQGVTVLRQGGCMVNASEYRWKKMIGPREQRPPYRGWWYPHSSNGWGILDFLNFCEAAGILPIPDVNMGETPQDMADFVDYVNGSQQTEWGRRRAADGHPAPYKLKYVELGNEEKVNEDYWQKFKPLAEAMWARDPELILVVGDFAYSQPIVDPFHFTGAAGKITSLTAHEKILALAKQHDREVWFDVHIGTEGPRPDWGGAISYIDALGRVAAGAKHRVVIFEFNAGNHSQRRALANALAINAIERDGRIPIATSANCLQPDGQNDNDWNQGLLFLNPSSVWLQPPGYVTQMISHDYLPQLVHCQVAGVNDALDVNAKRSDDGQVLTLQAVNPTDRPVDTKIHLAGFEPKQPSARATELLGPLTGMNTAALPGQMTPQTRPWPHRIKEGEARYIFPPHSVTVLRFE